MAEKTFQVGDQVRIILKDSVIFGHEGEVDVIEPCLRRTNDEEMMYRHDYIYRVKSETGYISYFYAEQLEWVREVIDG